MVNARDIESVSPNALQLYFDGDACNELGCIKIAYVGRFLVPLQDMIKTELSYLLTGDVGKRGRTTAASRAELFLSQVLVDQNGVELTTSWEPSLFEESIASKAIRNVVEVIETVNQKEIEKLHALGERKQRFVNSLLHMFSELKGEGSGVCMTHACASIRMTYEDVENGIDYLKMNQTELQHIIMRATLDGVLPHTGKFEATLIDGLKIKGTMHTELDDSRREDLASQFISQECDLHLTLKIERSLLASPKTQYLLRDISKARPVKD
jgi:hypothetical protein